jgi:PIN domain nuclease of toxin-antitoxin system
MRLLIDTHALIWAVDRPAGLSPIASTLLQDPSNQLNISVATIWEIAIKVGVQKISLSQGYRPWIEKAIADLGLHVLPINLDYAEIQSSLPHHHRDPFDRLLIVQSMWERMPLVSSDTQLDSYGIARLW